MQNNTTTLKSSGDQLIGPDDAFEVALLDANTGLSLLGGTGLTHNDAIINRQADGTEHSSSAVTRRDNADGSFTYVVKKGSESFNTVLGNQPYSSSGVDEKWLKELLTTAEQIDLAAQTGLVVKVQRT